MLHRGKKVEDPAIEEIWFKTIDRTFDNVTARRVWNHEFSKVVGSTAYAEAVG
jgi:hypothetical protein